MSDGRERTFERALVWTGGVALLAATASDTLAAIGRYVGISLRGSIELIQPAILLAGLIAILFATMVGASARVRLLVDRLPERVGLVADRIDDVLTAIFLGGLLAGSVWIAADLWDGYEVSEIVGVPWRALRLMTNVAIAAAILAALWRAMRGGERP
jgi:TRAP-type C4-dicarboxylate transport system permease small subunit